MTFGPLLDKINTRVALDKEEGDIAYFHALSLELEYLTKVATAALVACLLDDPDRHRYTLEHGLVRGNAIGEWVDALNTALTGPAAQFFDPSARPLVRDFTERVSDPDWRYRAVNLLARAALEVGMEPNAGAKVALRQFFQIGAHLRNRTRGHGATTSAQCSRACLLLADALELLRSNLQLFRVPWAYLRRNLSGKYKVSALLGDCAPFDYLKKTRDVRLPDGVFLYAEKPIHVPLIFSDPDLLDLFVPNGNFRATQFEILSYVSNESKRQDASPWLDPPARLPPSDTQGRTALEQVGNTFANLPPRLSGYVRRPALESKIRTELLTTDRHPIVTLTGPGGIGKTTIAIAALEEIAHSRDTPYEVILWISARDIDLLPTGPKPVAPRVVTQRDIADAAVELLEPSERGTPNFRSETYFQTILMHGAAGPTLFVFDNFETLENPADVYRWIDTYVRPPNKVLITTRFRDFVGDYAIEVGGMTDEEATGLIDQEAQRLGIGALITSAYKQDLIRESDGHPYVIKMLLGRVAQEGRAVKPERIVASADHLLRALFERTYGNLTPAAQRVFLLLCSWRVFVPEVAVEAVLMRPENERFDVRSALMELRRFSLVEEVHSDVEGETFVGVPLAAAMYGRRKLEVSPLKVVVEADRALLLDFGAGRREDVHHGVLPRIERLIRTVAARASRSPGEFEKFLPILEYLASRIPRAYIRLAELVLELDGPEATEKAKDYLRSFLETAPMEDRLEGWLKVADLCRSDDDAVGEVHALSEAALLPTTSSEETGGIANRLNNRIRELKGRRIEDAWSDEVRALLEKVIRAMENRLPELSATDCSRLAWLLLNIGNSARARDIAKKGLERDPSNEYCLRLIEKLGQ